MNTPLEVTNFNRTKEELEKFWLFCIFVAGKNSTIQLKKLNEFLPSNAAPFDYIRANISSLRQKLIDFKIGQYGRIEKSIKESLDLDLAACSVEDLTRIHGIGPKTSRFFLLHSRRDCDHIVLDTHLLRWLRNNGISAPKSTPSEPKYSQIEKQAQEIFNLKFPNKALAEIDLEIWAMESGRENAA